VQASGPFNTKPTYPATHIWAILGPGRGDPVLDPGSASAILPNCGAPAGEDLSGDSKPRERKLGRVAQT
jgi:hypothetical protein